MKKRHIYFEKFSKTLLLVFALVAINIWSAAKAQVNARKFAEAQILNLGLHASDSDLSAKKVTLKYDKVSIEKLLKYLEQQEHIRFSYYKGLLANNPKVTLRMENIALDKALKKIFKNTSIDFFSIKGGYIILRKKGQKEAEQQKISGSVTDAKTGNTIPGANVIVKGTNIGTATDANGYYDLNVPSLQDTLMVSFVGYKTAAVPISGRTKINIQLKSQTLGGKEVVVVGYGSVQKSDLTGSVSSVEVDELNQGVTSSVDQMLVGKSSGVNVVQNGGEPGAGLSINIRGAGSINASNSPLYVIDGVPIDSHRNIQGSGTGIGSPRSGRSPLASLNPEDIKSIEILKDASATAIYGSRGANGVVLITTKGGQENNFQIDYNGYVGIQNVSHKLDLLEPQEYKTVLNNIIDAGGESNEFRVGDSKNATDWQDQVSNKNAFVQNQQLSFSGGSDKTTYYLSFNYMNQEGLIKSSQFNRYNGRINIDSKITDKFSVKLNLTTSYTSDDFTPHGAGINENGGAIYAAQMFDPTLPVKNSDGSYAISQFISIDNPLALINGVDSRSNTSRTFGSAKAEYDFTNSLYGEIHVGTDIVDETRKTYISQLTKRGRNTGGLGTVRDNKQGNYLFEGTLHYSKTFGIHDVDAMAGVSYQRFVTNNIFQRAEDFPSDAVGADNLGLGDQSTYELNTNKTGHRVGSYIGRVNYKLKDKYLLTATLRVDGSSRFGKNNRFSAFPSFAIGWKLKDEPFLNNLDYLSSLKLRASWGESGNQEIGNYPSIPTYQQGQTAIWDEQTKTTASPSRIPNPNLKWETTTQIDVGLDFGFLEDRMTGSFDYYRKLTSNMLLNLPIPTSSGFGTQLTNIGSILNTGLEFSLNTANITHNNFSWSSDLTASTLHNEVKDIGPLSQIIVGGGAFFTGDPAIILPGEPLNSFYGYEIEGVWQENDDFTSTSDNVHPGSLKFKDQNADGTVNADDRVVLGNSFPDLSVSLGNTFNYRNLELYVFIDAVEGVKMLNANKVETYYPVNFRRNKYAKPYLNRWTPDNPSNTYPSFVDQYSQGAKPINSYTVEDASYIKLKTIRLSYTIPHFTNSIRNTRVYVTGENLYTITGYEGYDPAVNPRGSASYRIDLNAYPTARTFMFGIQLGL